MARLLCHRVERVKRAPSRFPIVCGPIFRPAFFFCSFDPGTRWRSSHAPIEFSGQPAATKRAPRNDSKSFAQRDRNKFPFRRAAEQIILRLETSEWLPTVRETQID